ncbi:hypothetical protein Mp_1g29650 [Marchantia polymorpha subsp. ruderalis]|uniref:Uncharacterized protein n=2 Tax=Marchantia polymorpha TaxID=3197 RepID=A0AAF6AVM8_MARPO|nr:hypothetical protein MARPO_0139s0009 [Marchantia polymorpha]BBN00499.1 hypothetical protein Mp_1g29650 [Marchantia polymorpha subsp. ruderalis]|eukprot:PTQ29531.1 hypothetical protein MARPO_0139s0009 [Marchantia polymorpha]
MSTRDDPKKVSNQSARYLRREGKKEDLEDPQERDQRKGKGKGKRPVSLLLVIAPPQTRRPANSPSTHEAYVREKDSNSVRSSGGTSRGESSGGESPSLPGSPRGGPPFPPNPLGGGGGGGGGPPDRPMGDQQGNRHPFTKHSYPKYKGREDDDADAYIKLFESVFITNKEDNEADRLRIFPSVLRKKAQS